MTVNKKSAITFIFITLLIDVIGIGIIIPVIPGLIKELTGGDLSSSAQIGSWLLFSYAIMQFLFSPVLGGLSDRFGRRPVLLLSLLGLGLDYILHAVAPTIAWLFIGRIIAGIFGASFTTASAYIADISEPEKRAQNFGLIGAAFGLGFIIGPAIGGLAGGWGIRAPFYIAAGLSLINTLYGYFILPESLPLEKRRPFDWKRANPIGSLKQLGRYPVISGLVGSLFLVYLASHAVQSNWSFYTMYKFQWTEQNVGFSLAIVGIIVAVVQGGLIRVIIPKLGQKRSVYWGMVLYALGLICFAMAGSGWLMLVSLLPYCLGGITGPAIQGIISTQVPDNEQGELQGGLTGLVSLTSIIGPVMMNNLFAYFTGKSAPIELPGAPFYAAAILSVMSLIFIMRALKTYPRHHDR